MPKTEANYEPIDITASDVAAASDFVLNPNAGKSRGWVLQLPADERVITQTFGLSGVVIFSGFQPQEIGTDPAAVCARGGSSHIYVVYANNANSVMQIGGTLDAASASSPSSSPTPTSSRARPRTPRRPAAVGRRLRRLRRLGSGSSSGQLDDPRSRRSCSSSRSSSPRGRSSPTTGSA